MVYSAALMSDNHQIAYVAFGANLGDPPRTLKQALPLLKERGMGELLACSSLYQTKALTLDGSVQPHYVNAVFAFQTTLSPLEVLRILLEVERALGRTRDNEARWTPRAIDLDLLFLGTRVHQDENLTLPHPELHKRDFVLVPLREIAPSFIHPVLLESIATLESTLQQRGFERFVLSEG